MPQSSFPGLRWGIVLVTGGLLFITSALVRDTHAQSSTSKDGNGRNDRRAVNDTLRSASNDTIHVLPPVRIRGQRVLDTTPPSVHTVRVESEELQRFAPSTVSDALLSVPGVDVVKVGPWASRPSVRGLSGDRILLMVDGVRMNASRGHGAESSLVPIDDVEMVELEAGSGSSQYGSSALGGVLNLVTRRGLFTPEPMANLALRGRVQGPGSGAGGSVRLRMSTTNLGFEISGGAGGLDALTSAQGAIPNSSYREENYTIRGAGRLGRWVLDTEYSMVAAKDVGLPAFNSDAGGTGNFPLRGRRATRLELSRVSPGFFADSRLLFDDQLYETQFEESTVDSVFVRRRFVGTSHTDTADDIESTSRGLQPTFRLRRMAVIGNVRMFGEVRGETSGGPRLTTEEIRDVNDNVTSINQDVSASVPDASRDSWAAGVDVSNTFKDLRLQVVARYDDIATQADSAPGHGAVDVVNTRTSVSGNVSYDFGALEPYALAGTGFRVANLDERFFNGFIHGALYVFGNHDLVPETSTTGQLGLRLRRRNGILREAHVSAYRTDVDNLISLQYIGQLFLVPRFQYVNIERARLEGYEASARLMLGKVGVDLNAGFPDGQDLDTGAALSDVGPTRASVDVSIPVTRLLPRSQFLTRVRWNDAVIDVSEPLQRESFTTVSLQLSWWMAGFNSVLSVQNLFNEFYQEPLNFIPEPGRTITFVLRREFDMSLSRIGKVD